MLLFAYYLLKVIICSGILYAYYLLALRNKIFHGWNRFYLLSAIVLSLAVPLIKIDIFQNMGGSTGAIQLLQVVSTGDEFVYEYTKNGGFHIDATNFSVLIYTVVSIFLSGFLIQTLVKIAKLKKNNNHTIVEGVNFINTNAEGTPFSFFNDIFWNDKIDINTPTGKQIFKHEVAHVQEKHSYDKIFINIVLIFFWCNPFFWLIRKELNIIHEFIADKKALEDSDTAAFAAMILQATYPQQRFTITNNFFYSPLKRRLAMLTKNKNPKMNYASRLLVLPLGALVFFAFTLKMKPTNSLIHYAGKKITVVIDAGHGGDDNGASVNGINEKDITLSLAKQMKELNKNENINIVLSRNADILISPIQRTDFAKSVKADLFISIHVDAVLNKTDSSGIAVLIPAADNSYFNASKILGSDIIESFKNNYQLPVDKYLKQRGKGVFVLKANEYPAVLIETGFLTNKKDLAYLIKPDNQKIIAKNILNGIEKYAMQKSSTSKDLMLANDTIPTAIDSSYKSFDKIVNINKPSSVKDSIPKFYKGKKMKAAQGDKLNKTFIYYEDGSSDTIPTKEAAKLRIIPPPSAMVIRDNDKVFTKTEVEPSFPGGDMAWKSYIKKVIETNINGILEENKSGTCRVRFIVNVDGTVSDIRVLSMQGTKLAKVSMDAISKGPRWVPAIQNGKKVNAYKEQPITFTMQEN